MRNGFLLDGAEFFPLRSHLTLGHLINNGRLVCLLARGRGIVVYLVHLTTI